MLIKPTTILSNEVDASPGGGAEPSAPSAPQAQTAPPAAPVIPVDAIKTAIAEALTTALPAAINGHFANARRNGDLKKDKADPPAPAPSAPAPTGLSMEDVQAYIKRDRAIVMTAAEHGLTAQHLKWLEPALAGVETEQIGSVVKSFASELGIVKAPQQPAATAQPAQPQPSNPQPLSDKGAPVPGGVLDWEREYQENPIGMSVAARRAMDAKYGADKARSMRLEAARQRAEGIRVTRPQG